MSDDIEIDDHWLHRACEVDHFPDFKEKVMNRTDIFTFDQIVTISLCQNKKELIDYLNKL